MGRIIVLFALVCVVLLGVRCVKTNNFTELEALYLRQELPRMEPKIFSPDLVSSVHQENSSLAFSPDGTELWWSRWRLPHDLDRFPQVIMYSRFENDVWSEPRVAPFSGTYRDGGPAFSPDGNKIYFYSRRPLDEATEEMHDNDIWFVERTKEGWSRPVNAGPVVNSSFVDATPCLAANGNLYLTSTRTQYEDPIGNNDIFVCEIENGDYTEPVGLGPAINTFYARDSFPFIAPDESYIIFSRDSRRFDAEGEVTSGDRKLMISFRDENGEWQEAIDMGPLFYKTRFPSVSPDGAYLFFTKFTEGGHEDFYWVDARIIEELRSNK